jgi:hypothetical protein
MRTKKYHKTKRSRHTKRRKNGGGWFTNIFKSKSQKAAEQAAAQQATAAQQAIAAQQARQLEADRQRDQKIAAREIALTADKKMVEKQWQKEDEEGWETPEELKNKIKQFSSIELAKRANNQKSINIFLQKEIATIQNDLGTCYPNGMVVIEQARMKDLQDELYTLKEQEKNLRLERKQLKTMIKTTPKCNLQKNLAKKKYQDAITGNEEIQEEKSTIVEREPEDIFYDTEENDLPANVEPLQQSVVEANTVEANTVEANTVEANTVEAGEDINADGEFINVDENYRPQKLTSTCDSSYYTADELNVCKAYNTIKKIIVQLIQSGNCAEIYLKPEKFYELVKKQVLDAIIQGNWLAVRAKMTAITLFLKAYPGIRKTVISTLTETRVFKALCEGVLENPNVDITAIADTFTNQLINTVIDNLITEYENNPKFLENMQWVQAVYYNYFDKKTMSQYSMGGGDRKKVSRKRKTVKVKKSKKLIKRKTRRY